jgi:MFS family permease
LGKQITGKLLLESNIEKTIDSKKPGVFYGYWVLTVAFLCLLLFSGCSVGVFSLFVKPLQSEFGWSRGDVMIAFSLLFAVMGLTAPFVGSLIDRFGVRGVIATGALAAGLSFASLNVMNHLWHFYTAYTVIGLGMAALGQVPASVMVSNWFVKRRGTAIGIMSTGIGAGVLVLAPITGGYLIPNFGWRASYLALAFFISILIPLALFVVRTKPADMGLYPDGVSDPQSIAEAQASRLATRGLSLKMALGTSAFWLIAVSFFINGFSQLGVIQNQVPHLQDIGFPLEKAATALTGLGIGSAIGKFAFGWLCDKMPPKYACAISFFFLITGTAIFLMVKPASSMAIIWLYAIIFGLGCGGWLPTMSMLINTYFGLTSYGAIFGMITLAQSLGGAIGPPFAGYMFDILNSYHWAFIVFLALYAVGLPAILIVRHPRSPQ